MIFYAFLTRCRSSFSLVSQLITTAPTTAAAPTCACRVWAASPAAVRTPLPTAGPRVRTGTCEEKKPPDHHSSYLNFSKSIFQVFVFGRFCVKVCSDFAVFMTSRFRFLFFFFSSPVTSEVVSVHQSLSGDCSKGTGPRTVFFCCVVFKLVFKGKLNTCFKI